VRAECIDNRRLDVKDETNITPRRACEDCKQTAKTLVSSAISPCELWVNIGIYVCPCLDRDYQLVMNHTKSYNLR